MPTLIDPALAKVFAEDIEILKTTKLPIVTVSASFKEDLKGFHGLPENDSIPDVVFSRAHYSMASGLASYKWENHVNPELAWVVDPTNYVSRSDWKKIELTEVVGKTLARHPLLNKIKTFIDKFGRKKLPILSSITPPLLHLFAEVDQPILSLHIAAGNILAAQGKTVVQVVTDPHVRDEYLDNVELPNFYLCVFDQKTRTDVLEKAAILEKKVDPNRVIITGPPIDPRIIKDRKEKKPWRNGKLNLCLTTGGLGTNKSEMRQIIRQLAPELKKHNPKYQLMVYAGTQADIAEMVKDIAKENRIKVCTTHSMANKYPHCLPLDKDEDGIFLIYHPQIVNANELLIKYGFPWADGFITKPSGDMAYDAAGSGSFILTLSEWGVWEHNISEFFQQKGIGREAQTDHFLDQLEALTNTTNKSQSWVEKAMMNAQALDKNFIHGAKNIIEVVENLKQS